jgi:hypothetical protein
LALRTFPDGLLGRESTNVTDPGFFNWPEALAVFDDLLIGDPLAAL